MRGYGLSTPGPFAPFFAFGRFRSRFGGVLKTTKKCLLLRRLRSRPKGVAGGPCGLRCGPGCSQKHVRGIIFASRRSHFRCCFLYDQRKCRNRDFGTPYMRFERFSSSEKVPLGYKSVHVRCLFVKTFKNPPCNHFLGA